jgi:hypothetical protein
MLSSVLAADSAAPAGQTGFWAVFRFSGLPPLLLRAGIPLALFGIYRSIASGGKIQ